MARVGAVSDHSVCAGGGYVTILNAPFSNQLINLLSSDYNVNWKGFQGKSLRISALDNSQLSAASSISLRQLNTSESSLEHIKFKDVAAVLKRTIVNQIFCQGSKLRLNFFNKPLIFSLESWRGVDESSVEQALERLSLDKSQQFVQVTSVTRIELLPNEDQAKQQQPQLQQRVTKAKIGGLDKQIQLVEESLDYALGYKPLPQGNYFIK